MLRVLVTGGSGFVARSLFLQSSTTMDFVAASRQPTKINDVAWAKSPDLGPDADWKPVLAGIDCVVHLAGRVHLPADANPAPYHTENVEGTKKLAQDAVETGVRRLVFLSSAKVFGDESANSPLKESDTAHPGDPYAVSKHAAERALASFGSRLQITILRPPLVYGPAVKANFLALLSAVDRGVPLPLASIKNRRSFIGVGNLASAILACIGSDLTGGRTYNVTDGTAVSTPSLVRALAAALQQPAALFRFPPRVLEACGALLGRGETVKRLTRSLELDDSRIRSELGWRAPQTFEDGIRETVRWYRSVYPETVRA